jgi:iron-sulfur cluster assembly protein
LPWSLTGSAVSAIDFLTRRAYIPSASTAGLEPAGQGRNAMGSARKFQVMSLTEAAAERVRAAIARSDKPVAGLRVGVKKGGCAGMEYTIEYAEKAQPLDEVIEDKGVTVFVDAKAVLYLLGTQMDVKTDKFASTFVFNNPNQTSACGCGESVALTPAALPPGQPHAASA